MIRFLPFLFVLFLASCNSTPMPVDIAPEGGSKFEVQLQVDDLLWELAGRPPRPEFMNPLNEVRDGESEKYVGFISQFVEEYEKQTPSLPLARFFSVGNPDVFDASMTNQEIESLLLTQFDQALERTQFILEQRFEQWLGYTPVTTIDREMSSITIELNGIGGNDPEEFMNAWDLVKAKGTFSVAPLLNYQFPDSLDLKYDLGLKLPEPACASVKSTDQIELFDQQLEEWSNLGVLPPDISFHWTRTNLDLGSEKGFLLYALEQSFTTEVSPSEKHIASAFDQEGEKVDIIFNSDGASIWSTFTESTLGYSVAYLIDDGVEDIQMVPGVMNTGITSIHSHQSKIDTYILNSGAYPCKVVVEEFNLYPPKN